MVGICEAVKRRLVYLELAGIASFFAIICVLAVKSLSMMDVGMALAKPTAKPLKKDIVQNVIVNRHGYPGVDFIKCGGCRLEKKQRGIFSFGAFNVLVIDNLSITIPLGEQAAKDLTSRTGDGRQSKEVLSELGVGGDFLMGKLKGVRFSDVRISNLEVSALTEDGKICKIFAAARAKGVRGGLALEGCLVYDDSGHVIHKGKSKLQKRGGKYTLIWGRGSQTLQP